jgi:hypothetical protein
MITRTLFTAQMGLLCYRQPLLEKCKLMRRALHAEVTPGELITVEPSKQAELALPYSKYPRCRPVKED